MAPGQLVDICGPLGATQLHAGLLHRRHGDIYVQVEEMDTGLRTGRISALIKKLRPLVELRISLSPGRRRR